MGIIDIIFICIIALGFISGLQKGLLASFCACCVMVGAWFITASSYLKLSSILTGSRLENWFNHAGVGSDTTAFADITNAISFALIFIIVFAALLLVVNLFNNVFRFPQLRVFDGLLGGILGIARAAVLVLVVVSALQIVFNAVEITVVTEQLDGSVIGKMIKDINILKSVI